MRKRMCAFCPEPASTGEHIWSDWVNPLLGAKRKYRITYEPQGANHTYTSIGLHQTLPVLCGDCNNKWGSQIETLMSNVARPMVKDGARTILEEEDIVTIAAYSQLKAFILDHAQDSVKSFYDFSERRAFRNDLTFPSGTNIWLAWTVDYHGVFTSAYAKPPLNVAKRFHTYIFTMSIGQLAIQLTSARWTKKSNRRYTSPPNLTQGSAWDSVSIPIWPVPVIPVDWPPPRQLGRDSLNAFFQRWKVVNRTDC